ncbi:MAG: protein kinase domain-containing protein [Acidimicrobiales bacterium]
MAPTFPLDYTLAQRYQITALIGTGKTAEVYLANDVALRRPVVVKVLLEDLAAHEEVRRAFRDHIVRASTLSHPHLARVFDGGQESGAIFMISEYLSGGSLDDLLNTGRRFSIDDGARLGRDVASALAYVHQQGFVIGSLSPSKLLFDDEGRVRVSDVALAGLATGYRERMTIHEARYLSPEQAIGEPADAKSDVYALSLILFESVTGSVAFEGSTPEAVLRARLNAPLPVRLELGTLDMVLAQAAVADPRLRLDAEQLSSRLGAVVSDAAPLVVRPGGEVLPLLAQFSPLEHRSSIGFQAPSPDQVVGASAGFQRAPRPRAHIQDPAGQVSRVGAGRTPRFDEGAYELPRVRQRRRWGYLITAIILVVVAVGAAVAWKKGYFASSHSVPSLVGLSLTQASTRLQSDGFALTVTQRVHSASVPMNDIVSQSPLSGANEKAGYDITVSVSEGPILVTLPAKLIGNSCQHDTQELLALHVRAQCPTSAAIYSTRISRNHVARVLYHTTTNPLAVPRGAMVTLALSKGPSPGTAASTTTTSSSTTTSTTTTTSTVPGQGPRPVPNVVGDDQAQVYAAMRAAKLYFRTIGHDSNSTKWTDVLSESPTAGTKVAWHSTVTLTVK